MRYLGGHLGTTVSALVDGQLDPASADRAWAHVHSCPACSRRVEREGWVKRQLTSMSVEDRGDPPAQLLGSLYGLSGRAVSPVGAHPSGGHPSPADPSAAWVAVEEIERRERGRRRVGLVVVGAGSVSAAVLGFATLGGAPLGISGTPSAPPTAVVSRPGSPATASTAMLAPTAHVHGRLPAATTGSGQRAD
jgi:anti-sigma factor RsiW